MGKYLHVFKTPGLPIIWKRVTLKSMTINTGFQLIGVALETEHNTVEEHFQLVPDGTQVYQLSPPDGYQTATYNEALGG